MVVDSLDSIVLLGVDRATWGRELQFARSP